MPLDGLHHITAITGDAPRNVAFYTGTLGLRMTAKTVNQDDPTVYHLFYGDEEAHPGLDLTFFEYPGAIPGRPGAGMVHRIVWRVGAEAALDFWAERLAAHDVAVARDGDSVRFSDPEGLDHELIVATVDDPPLIAEHPEIPAEHALQGFEGVRAYSAQPEGSASMLEDIMGATRREDGSFELRGEERGGWIVWDPAPAEPGRQSGGSVHHIAWGTQRADYEDWLKRLGENHVRNSGPIDRHYFESIYFREPGGVLYELATKEPGFLVDGLALEELGTKIILPPWLEERRAEIEARLTPLPDPREGWTRA
jgi:glyoxalase family protein